MVENDHHEIKFPGGGIFENEDEIDTLVREVKEETGYLVKVDTIRPFGIVEEKRLSEKENKIWHQTNIYFICEVYRNKEESNFTEEELELNFREIIIHVDEAIRRNEIYIHSNTINKREYEVLKLIKEKFNL
ncbi:NUDIX hydrolase [Acholeplasma hippikon]|uniref:NUDIX domain n=1 Tax=Acholeplasma hippikon TaxID=264636 RepID=A0A449BIC9_9MOLU|nr:NUDIX domain-containing protein [Acholeplasma hippikon]VEU82214.1 NUDIX domain [Acholeplasma hippikon]